MKEAACRIAVCATMLVVLSGCVPSSKPPSTGLPAADTGELTAGWQIVVGRDAQWVLPDSVELLQLQNGLEFVVPPGLVAHVGLRCLDLVRSDWSHEPCADSSSPEARLGAQDLVPQGRPLGGDPAVFVAGVPLLARWSQVPSAEVVVAATGLAGVIRFEVLSDDADVLAAGSVCASRSPCDDADAPVNECVMIGGRIDCGADWAASVSIVHGLVTEADLSLVREAVEGLNSF